MAVDLLDWLASHTDLELSNDGMDTHAWQVYRINGPKTMRLWTLMGEGSTPRAALQAAYNEIEGRTRVADEKAFDVVH